MSLHVLRNIFVCFVSLVVLTALGLFPAFARDGDAKILDHVYVIVLENRGFDEALYNGPSPFLLGLSGAQGLATCYFG